MPATIGLTPRTDDRLICELSGGVIGSLGVAIAHEVGVFRFLANGPRTAGELCAALGLSPRPVEALLILCISAGLLRVERGAYSLTAVAEDYLVETSPMYAGSLFEFWSGDNPFSYVRLLDAVKGDGHVVHGRREWIESHRDDAERAASFTRIMHGHSMAPALVWPQKVDLDGCRRLLDVGGGSGAHSIGALLHWPGLEAIVLDLPPVCIAAQRYIAQYGMTQRITTRPADMWMDAWPEADVHFFSDIFHDWTPDEGRTLAARSFDGLPRGGRILVHEMLYDDDKQGPFIVAAESLAMLTFCGGQQFSGRELTALLHESGFDDVAVVPTFGYWSVVTGTKR